MVEPLVAVTVMVYCPGEVGEVVLMVIAGVAGGIADAGLNWQVGRLTAWVLPVVTAQLKETAPLKLPMGCKFKIATELPVGSTAGGESADRTVSVKVAVWAVAGETAAAGNSDRKKEKTRARTTCLGFTMNEWKLTTFDSSDDAKAARGGEKEHHQRVRDRLIFFEQILPLEQLQNTPERILD
jgi:hypothetical protein